MLDPEIEYQIFDLVPTSFMGDSITATKLSRVYSSPEYDNPVIAVQFIHSNAPYFKSIGEFWNYEDTKVNYKRYSTTTLRLVIGASDVRVNITQEKIYSDATQIYRLLEPVLTTVSIPDYTIDVDYQLINNNLDIEWLIPPADGTPFNVTYDAVRPANFTVAKLLYELNKWSKETLDYALCSLGISVMDGSATNDLSKAVGQDNVIIRVLDIPLVYPDTWSVELGDALTPLESIDMTVDDVTFTETI